MLAVATWVIIGIVTMAIYKYTTNTDTVPFYIWVLSAIFGAFTAVLVLLTANRN